MRKRVFPKRISILNLPSEQWIRVMELQNEDWKIVAEDRDFIFDFELGECQFSADFGSCWPSN
jgi:hypothetical protein